MAKFYRLLASVLVFLTFNANATDTYNHLNNQLSIPAVILGNTVYRDVVITVREVLTVGGSSNDSKYSAKPSSIFDTYDPVTNRLTIPNVIAFGIVYHDVIVTVDKVVSVGSSNYITSEVFIAPDKYTKITVTRSLSNTAHGYRVVQSPEPTRAGNFAQRFELRPGDCHFDATWSDCTTDRSRTEVLVEQNMTTGEEYWFSFSLYLPSDFETSSTVKSTIGQIKPRGGPSGEYAGFASLPSLFQIYALGNEYNLCWQELINPATATTMCTDIKMAKIDEMKGKWTDVAIHFSTSQTSGFLHVYVNQQLKGSINKPLVNYPARNFFAKYGIYNTLVSRNGVPMPTQVVYFDEVKIERTKQQVMAFSPAVD
jgi:hypothetical protein